MALASNPKSTIVRSIRVAFGVLERAAPGLGSWWAERLWCSAPRGKVRPFSVPGARSTVLLGDRRIAVESWGEGPVVYLMHGWSGWRGQWDAFVAPLLATGHKVVALDAPSHGDSDPGAFGAGRGLLTEFAAALAAVVEVHGPAHAVLAHSGGGIASAIAVFEEVPTRKLVLISAVADFIPYSHEYAAFFGFGEKIRSGFLRRLERRVGRPMSDFNLPARAAMASTLPELLIVHDRKDKQVHVRDAAAIAAAWPGATVLYTEGLGHNRILRDPAVVATVIGFLQPSIEQPVRDSAKDLRIDAR